MSGEADDDELVEHTASPRACQDGADDHAGTGSTWSVPPEGIPAWRRQRRAELLAARIAMPARERARAAETVARVLDELVVLDPDTLISLYWPFRGELNLRGWMHDAWRRGARIALPVVVRKAAPLVFREWTPDARLEPGVWNIPVPVDGAVVDPSVVIAPLVGFDPVGFRLGYGGGFFDRTLAALAERQRPPTVIGVGHSATRLDTIHPLPHDIPMQTIITEAGVFEIER